MRNGFSEGLDELEADPLYLRLVWYNMERDRLRNPWYLRENHGRGGFPEYIEEVKRRLKQRGFTRTFQLEEDPKQQDKLTTWIEYLNYEYSWYDKCSRDIKRLQPQYDKAWQKLVHSGVLRPSETDKYLRTTESAFRRESEREQAKKAVESAKSAANTVLTSTQNEPQRSSLTKSMRVRMMRKAHSRLNKVKESPRAIARRDDLITNFIRGTWDYKTAERNVKRQRIRLQWILEQVPRIVAELNELEAAKSTSNAERDTNRRLGRDKYNEITPDRTLESSQSGSETTKAHAQVAELDLLYRQQGDLSVITSTTQLIMNGLRSDAESITKTQIFIAKHRVMSRQHQLETYKHPMSLQKSGKVVMAR